MGKRICVDNEQYWGTSARRPHRAHLLLKWVQTWQAASAKGSKQGEGEKRPELGSRMKRKREAGLPPGFL